MSSNEESFSTYTDTDILDIRLERLQKEEDMYIKLGEYMKGKSIVERITEIREMLFDRYENIKGDVITKVRDKDVHAGGFRFITLDETNIRLFGDLTKRIDRLYEYLIKDSEEGGDTIEFDKVVRFSSIVYSLGVTLHPYIDGNGQTFRIAAVSYISELVGKPYRLASKIIRSAPTELIEWLPKDQPINQETSDAIKLRVYEGLSKDLQSIVQLKLKKPTRIILNHENDSLVKRILSISTETRSNPSLMLQERKSILSGVSDEWKAYFEFILDVLEMFPDEIFNSLDEIYQYPSDYPVPEFDDATLGIYKYSESKQVELLKRYLEEVLAAEEYHSMFIQFIDTGSFDPGSSRFGNVLLGVLINTERQIKDICKEIPLNNEEGIVKQD